MEALQVSQLYIMEQKKTNPLVTYMHVLVLLFLLHVVQINNKLF